MCKYGTHRAPCTTEELASLLNGALSRPDNQGPSGRRDMMSYLPHNVPRHRVQVHSCTKSNRPANSFILFSVAARGSRVRIFEARHFQLGMRGGVGSDRRVQLEDLDATDAKALITLTILNVLAL